MFSAPLWLFGLVALAIPLILHLWSRRPRQVIRVGTLRHVELTADALSWSARLTEPLLLALRLALLLTIVLALAGLRLPARHSAGSGATIILVDPALLTVTGFPFIDSLRREQEPVRLLLPGLPKYQFGASADTMARPAARDVWSAVAEAGEIVGPRGVIHVAARPRLIALTGARPHLRARVDWHTPEGAEEARWSPARWREGDTTLMVLASGDRRKTVYALGRTMAACDGCTQPAPRSVLVRATDSVADRRIDVALRAIATELALQITRVSTLDSADALISDGPVSDSLIATGVPIVLLTPATVRSPAIVDSLWTRWPWPLVGRDARDPREVSLSQVLPAAPGAALAPLGDPEATRRGLLLLALLLFGLERWLATRAGRSPA